MDLNKEIRSFAPIDIEKFSQNNEVSEKLIDSIKLYNKAIKYLKTGSEDIAIIELKKAVSINPDFYEAVNLLGLCYAYTNQMDKAEALFGKAVQGGDKTQKALDYLNYFNTGDSNLAKKQNKAKNSTPINKPSKTSKTSKTIKDTKKKDGFNNVENVQTEYFLLNKISSQLKRPSTVIIINLFSVICLVAAIILFFTATRSTDKVKVDSDVTNNTELTDSYNKVVAENKSLKSQLATANIGLKQIKLSADLSQVSSLYGQGKFVEAADKLMVLPLKELSADLKTKYDSIKSDVLLKAANQLTKEGNILYGSKKYAEAIKKLEKVFTYGDKWTFGDKALYILGKSYVEVNENQKGAAAYQKLINQYPNSGYIKFAKDRLKAIQ